MELSSTINTASNDPTVLFRVLLREKEIQNLDLQHEIDALRSEVRVLKRTAVKNVFHRLAPNASLESDASGSPSSTHRRSNGNHNRSCCVPKCHRSKTLAPRRSFSASEASEWSRAVEHGQPTPRRLQMSTAHDDAIQHRQTPSSHRSGESLGHTAVTREMPSSIYVTSPNGHFLRGESTRRRAADHRFGFSEGESCESPERGGGCHSERGAQGTTEQPRQNADMQTMTSPLISPKREKTTATSPTKPTSHLDPIRLSECVADSVTNRPSMSSGAVRVLRNVRHRSVQTETEHNERRSAVMLPKKGAMIALLRELLLLVMQDDVTHANRVEHLRAKQVDGSRFLSDETAPGMGSSEAQRNIAKAMELFGCHSGVTMYFEDTACEELYLSFVTHLSLLKQRVANTIRDMNRLEGLVGRHTTACRRNAARVHESAMHEMAEVMHQSEQRTRSAAGIGIDNNTNTARPHQDDYTRREVERPQSSYSHRKPPSALTSPSKSSVSLHPASPPVSPVRQAKGILKASNAVVEPQRMNMFNSASDARLTTSHIADDLSPLFSTSPTAAASKQCAAGSGCSRWQRQGTGASQSVLSSAPLDLDALRASMLSNSAAFSPRQGESNRVASQTQRQRCGGGSGSVNTSNTSSLFSTLRGESDLERYLRWKEDFVRGVSHGQEMDDEPQIGRLE